MTDPTPDFRDFRALCQELLDRYDLEWRARELIKAALATPPPEPVAYIHRQGNHWEVSERVLLDDEKKRGWTEEPLYADTPPTAPPTDDELNALWNCCGDHDEEGDHYGNIFQFARAAIKRWGGK